MEAANITCYVPVHTNFAQVESVAPFLEAFGGKLFVYRWNPDGKSVVAPLTAIPGVVTQQFSEENFLKSVMAEKKKVVVLLTASTNFGFGLRQKQMFERVRAVMPDRILDVVTLGHCMYGCDSCTIYEHSLPIAYTRFVKKTLPLPTVDLPVEAKVGPKSFLSRVPVVVSLISALDAALLRDPDRRIVIKLHPFTALSASPPHPLHSLTPNEVLSVKALTEWANGSGGKVILLEPGVNVLPILELSEALVCDLDSSVPFEQLFFCSDASPRALFAFYDQANAPELALADTEYLSLLNTWTTPLEFYALMEAFTSPSEGKVAVTRAGAKGHAFFAAKYGEPDGKEVEKMSAARSWPQKAKAAGPYKALSMLDTIQQIGAYQKLVLEAEKADPTLLDDVMYYLSRGLAVPERVLQFTLFLQQHIAQLEAHHVPRSLWSRLHDKLVNETFHAGNSIGFGYDDDLEEFVVLAATSLQAESDIFLVDHLWTATRANFRTELEERQDTLLPRLELLRTQSEPEGPVEERIKAMEKKIWTMNDSYVIADETGTQQELWYVMDEVGARMNHSPEPTVASVPFIYTNPQGVTTAYNLFWPLVDLEEGDELTRDFTRGYAGNSKYLELAWKMHLDPEEDEDLAATWTEIDSAFATYDAEQKRLSEESNRAQRFNKTLTGANTVPRGFKAPIKVYSDMELVLKNLTWTEEFELLDETQIAEAEVMYIAMDASQSLRPQLFSSNIVLNQFDNEHALTYKHELLKTLQTRCGDAPWFKRGYNLDTQMAEFLGDFRAREKRGEKNLWIIKPWNLARGHGIVISSDVVEIMRLAQAGPKLASEYIDQPVLYEGRKFDLRYIVMVRSLEPLEVYRFNMFWIRLANKQFKLEEFDDYEVHFTVNNYSGHFMQQLLYTDFIDSFQKQHNVDWNMVQGRMDEMMRELFTVGAAELKARGQTVKAGAIYGLDVMIEKDMQPVLLEVNFSPDCTRACNYDPNFFNDVFSVLYSDTWQQHPIASKSVTPL